MPRNSNYKAPWHSLAYFETLLWYNHNTGNFTWIAARPRVKVGRRAGGKEASGYIVIEIDGFAYKAHRLAWLFVRRRWPPKDIDHKNRIRHKNAIYNLRRATRSQNVVNSKMRSDCTSGITGVSWAARQNRWKAQIRNQNKTIAKYFISKKEAALFYKRKRVEIFGEFAQ
jgi:hypothetical protein